MKKTHALIYSALALGMPLAVGAQDSFRQFTERSTGATFAGDGCSAKVADLSGLITRFSCIANSLIGPIMLVALLYFLWAGVQFIRADDKGRDEARTRIIYGLIGLFVMVAVWGLVGVISGTFGFQNTAAPVAPTYPR